MNKRFIALSLTGAIVMAACATPTTTPQATAPTVTGVSGTAVTGSGTSSTVTATVTAGSTVTTSFNGTPGTCTVVGTTATCAVTVPAGVANGSQSVTVTATNGGLSGSGSGTISVNRDVSQPPAVLGGPTVVVTKATPAMGQPGKYTVTISAGAVTGATLKTIKVFVKDVEVASLSNVDGVQNVQSDATVTAAVGDALRVEVTDNNNKKAVSSQTVAAVNPPVLENPTGSLMVNTAGDMDPATFSASLSLQAGTGATLKTVLVKVNGVDLTTYTLPDNTATFSQSVSFNATSLGLTNGTYNVQVIGTDSAGKQVSLSEAFVVAFPAPPVVGVPTTINTIGITTVDGNNVNVPRVGINADGSDPMNVVRVLGQNSCLGENVIPTYARGMIVFTATPTGTNAVDHVDFKIIDTSNGQAVDYLTDTGAAVGGVYRSKPYDTSMHSDLEGRGLKVVAVVTYANGAQEVNERVFIVDRTGPQAADPEFRGATTTEYSASNAVRNFNGINNNNWARGAIVTYISNDNLKDLPGEECDVAGVDHLPAGLENVSYYLVRDADLSKIPAQGSASRVAAIRSLAVNFDRNVSEDKGSDAFAYRSTVRSGAAARITNPAGDTSPVVADGRYYLFAVSRDRLGNSTASTTYEQITFDNIGPRVNAAGVVDTSPLPFAAQPSYVSDHGRISGLTLVDGPGASTPQIGFAGGTFAYITFGGLSFPIINNTVGNTSIASFNVDFDSNQIADGVYNVGANGVGGGVITDILGNPGTVVNGSDVTVDNTDPGLSFTAPAQGQTYSAFEQVNIQTSPTDATAGLFATSLFWNDYVPEEFFGGIPFTGERSRANGFVGAPVEISRGTASDNNISNGSNARWNALYPLVEPNGPQPMVLNALAVDKAGNATLRMRQIVVRANNNPIPAIGQFDVHGYNAFPSYHVVGLRTGVTPADLVAPQLPSAETEVREVGGVQYTAEIRVPGTLPDSALDPDNTDDRIAAEGVNFYRQMGTANWARVKLWQTVFDPSIDRNDGLRDERIVEWTRVDQDFVNFLAATSPYYTIPGAQYGTSPVGELEKVVTSLDAAYLNGNAFGTQTASVAPWLRYGNTETSSTVHKSTSQFDSLYNAPAVTVAPAQYVLTGPGGVVVVPASNVRTYNPAVKNPSTTAVAGVVHDTAGKYNFTFEGVTRLVDGIGPTDQ